MQRLSADETGAAHMSRRRLALNLAVGAAIFSAVGVLAYGYFLIYHKSLVWVLDGAAQYFPATYYLNHLVRSFLHDPTGGLSMWSWQLGLGADVISTLSFYGVGDPFMLISLLFPMRSMELAFTAVFAARIFAAGLFSLLYLRKMGAKPFESLLGCLLYTFAAFSMFYAARHVPFGTALALFPLLLLGVEYALQRRRPWLLVVATFFSAAGNYYFFYGMILTTIIYAIARFIEVTPKGQRLRRVLPDGLYVAALCALGVMLAAPILVPTLIAATTTMRRQVSNPIPLLFSLRAYGSYLASVVAPVAGPNFTTLGFSMVGLVTVPALFARRGRHLALKVMLVALPLSLATPWLSAAYNGFTFPSGRFGFQWGLFIALAFALQLSEEEPFTRSQLAGMGLGFAGLCALLIWLNGTISVVVLISIGLGAVALAIFALERFSKRASSRDLPRPPGIWSDWSVTPTRWAVFALVVIGIVSSGIFLNDVRFGNSLRQNIGIGQVLTTYTANPGAAISSIEDDSFFRAANTENYYYNEALVQGYRGIGFYFSLMDGDLTRTVIEHDIRGGWGSWNFNGFDDRVALTGLAAVKYYATDNDLGRIPFGYQLSKRFGTTRIYRNTFDLPIGVLYPSAIDRAEYDKLPTIAKQQALLQGAVFDAGQKVSIPATTPAVDLIDVPYTVTSEDGAALGADGRSIDVTRADGRIDLSFAPIPDSELYIEIKNSDHVLESPVTRLVRDTPAPTEAQLKEARRAERRQASADVITHTTYSSGSVTKSELWQSRHYAYYWGNRSNLVNLGYRSHGATSAAIAVEAPSTVTFESLKIYAVPMNSYRRQVAGLRASAMRSVKVDGDHVSGTIESTTGGVVVLSIPHSGGWRAQVDGVDTPVLRVNTGFSGVIVTPGAHTIVMRYVTPGLRAGMVMFGLALLAMALVGLRWITLRRRRVTAGT